MLLHPFILATCRCVALVPVMVQIIEACFDTYFTAERDFMNPADMFGWSSLLSMLEVPELSHKEFIDVSVQQGCFLTLYAYILQKLPLSQNLGDEMKCLQSLVEWSSNAKPVLQNETKILLWWDKVLELSLRQVDFGGDLKTLAKALLNFSLSIATLGEDKASTGLLGAIGLGKKSQLSQRFRLVAKSLSAYLAAQLPNDFSIRLQPNAAGHITLTKHSPTKSPGGSVRPSQQTVQYYQHLESLKTNKQYVPLAEQVEFSLNFVSKSEHSLREAPILYLELVKKLFPECHYLEVVKRNM